MSPNPTKQLGGLARLVSKKSAQAWIAVFSTLCVVLIALVDAGRTMPGPLSAVHGALGELDNGEDCSSCHGGIFSNMTDSCLECHELVSVQMAEGGGLHGTFSESQKASCALCHSEHHGANFDLVNLASFKRAGIDNPEAFDHALLGFQMDGRHLELTCSECHTNAEVDFLPAGERRFMGLDPSCVRCHDDPHDGRMVRSCEECHAQSDFNDLHALGHDEHLSLVGGHRASDCRTCHAEDEPRSLEDLARGLRNKRPRNCMDCHEAPHAKRLIRGVAKFVKKSNGASCVTCHLEQHTSFAGDGAPEELIQNAALGTGDLAPGLGELMTPRLHATTGFPLAKPHNRLACSDCHLDVGREYSDRFPGRKPESCSICHEDPHAGQFAEGLFEGQECTACHQEQRFDPHNFDIEAHKQTSFPLEGSHLTADCAACHVDPPRDSARVFHGTRGQCQDCHDDAHLGFFDAALSGLDQKSEQGSCSECHLPSRFDDVLLVQDPVESDALDADLPAGRPFDHGPWTEFALGGAHAQEACEVCHPRADTADELGRRFGFVAEHFGPFENCASCHQDPHEGVFDKHVVPEKFKGDAGCLRCHTENSFRTLPNGFDHDLWTGFELNGAHAAASCEVCHAPLQRPTEQGRTWKHAIGENCGDCHAEPHARQFDDLDGVTDCSRCHRSADAWDELRFNHDRHSRFPLADSHQQVACSACHTTWELESGVGIVRYRPLETSCASCHGSQRGPALRRRGKRD